MSTTPFEIKVVYDSTQRKRRGAVVHTAKAHSSRVFGVWLILGALMHLAVSGAMYYVTWWKADQQIYLVILQKMPLDVSQEFASNPLGISAATFAAATEQVATEDSIPSPTGYAEPRFSGKTAQRIIPGVAYAWLTFATASACAVALVCGAWLGLAGGSWVRGMGLIGVVAMVGFLGYAGVNVWIKSKMMFEPDQLRRGMGLLTLLFALIGVPLAGRARGLTKFAGVIVLVAAFVTAAALWLWAQSGALEISYAAWPKVAAAFAIHAAWGIVLFVMARRMRA